MTTQIIDPPFSVPAPSSSRLKIFAGLTGLTSLAIFALAITAGQFVSQDGKDSWITAHGVIADVAWIFALITTIFAVATLRHFSPRIVAWTAALFVLTLAQTGIGHLITDKGQDGWIAVHVPLAFVIFGLTGWLSVRAATMRRAL